MTVTTIINGGIKIILTPDTEVDKVILAQFRSGAISMEKANENFLVANKPLPDSVILSNEVVKAVVYTDEKGNDL